MAPCRTSCIICSSHGGVKELIERRTSSSAEAMPSPDGRARRASCSTPGSCCRDENGGEAWDTKGRCFGVARSAVAGVMVAELAKVLKPRCRRDELRNWTLRVDTGRHCSNGGGRQRRWRSGGHDDKTKEGDKPRPTPESVSGLVGQPAGKVASTPIRPVVTSPDPPLMVLSTSFDPFSGDSLRAIPEGFTEWGVEEIRPSMEIVSSPRLRNVDVGNLFSLRTLISLVFARFGVDAKSVAAAAPGSECRVGSEGCQERGGASGGNILWAEWEKAEGNHSRQDGRRTRGVVCKVCLVDLACRGRPCSAHLLPEHRRYSGVVVTQGNSRDIHTEAVETTPRYMRRAARPGAPFSRPFLEVRPSLTGTIPFHTLMSPQYSLFLRWIGLC